MLKKLLFISYCLVIVGLSTLAYIIARYLPLGWSITLYVYTSVAVIVWSAGGHVLFEDWR